MWRILTLALMLAACSGTDALTDGVAPGDGAALSSDELEDLVLSNLQVGADLDIERSARGAPVLQMHVNAANTGNRSISGASLGGCLWVLKVYDSEARTGPAAWDAGNWATCDDMLVSFDIPAKQSITFPIFRVPVSTILDDRPSGKYYLSVQMVTKRPEFSHEFAIGSMTLVKE